MQPFNGTVSVVQRSSVTTVRPPTSYDRVII